MAEENYWVEFWNKNEIIERKTAHEKVGRTINGVPIDEDSWKKNLDDLEKHLALSGQDHLLDIAAGSGVIAIPFSQKVETTVALDISEKLLSEMAQMPKIKTMVADARSVFFEENTFTKVIIYFAIQHFNESETVLLFQKIYKWLKPGGILFVGDIPDSEKKFIFFNDKKREDAYFNSLINNQPIIGTWFDKEFIKKAGTYAGFSNATILAQPASYINAHYRFDAKFIK